MKPRARSRRVTASRTVGLGGPLHGVGRQLDARDGAVMAHAQLGTQAELAQHVFGGGHLAQLVGGDRLVVGDTRGQAGFGGLAPGGQIEGPGEGAHGRLSQSGLDQRVAHAVLGRGAQAGPFVAQIVAVGAVDQSLDAGFGGGPLHGLQQGRLAVVATIARVGHEALVVELAGLPGEVADAERLGKGAGRGELVVAIGLGDGREGQHLAGAEHARGHRQHDARVDAARERHADPPSGLSRASSGSSSEPTVAISAALAAPSCGDLGHQPPVMAGAPWSANSGVDR